MSIGTTHSKSETRVRCLSQDTLRAGTSRALQVRARERVHFGLIARRWVAIREANSSRVKTRAAMVVVTEFVTDDRSGGASFFAVRTANLKPLTFKAALRPTAEEAREGTIRLATRARRSFHPTATSRTYGRPRTTYVYGWTGPLLHRCSSISLLQEMPIGTSTVDPGSRIALIAIQGGRMNSAPRVRVRSIDSATLLPFSSQFITNPSD